MEPHTGNQRSFSPSFLALLVWPQDQNMASIEIGNPSKLLELPIELWRDIADHLSLASAVSLACSCRSLYTCLGARARKDLNRLEYKAEKIRFLTLLNRSLPTLLLCHTCAKYHPWNRLQFRDPHAPKRNIPSHHNPDSDCLTSRNACLSFRRCDDRLYRVALSFGNELEWQAVQLVMRAHQLGSPQHGIPLRMIAQDRYVYHQGVKSPIFREKVDAVIVQERLLIRIQSFLLDRTTRLSIEDQAVIAFRAGECYHSRLFNRCGVMQCAVNHLKDASHNLSVPSPSPCGLQLCLFCKALRRCDFCATEWMYSVETVTRKGWLRDYSEERLTLTCWKDLGDGISPYHEDWKSISRPLYSIMESQLAIRTRAFNLGEHERSVRTHFESHFGSRSCESLVLDEPPLSIAQSLYLLGIYRSIFLLSRPLRALANRGGHKRDGWEHCHGEDISPSGETNGLVTLLICSLTLAFIMLYVFATIYYFAYDGSF